MRILATLFLISIASTVFSCSIAPRSFCEVSYLRPTHNVISGKIIDTVPHGIRLQIINVIRGVELRDTVIIWDGTDVQCNGPFSQAAFWMGEVGDTILTVMQTADTIGEPWQVLGDYIRPY